MNPLGVGGLKFVPCAVAKMELMEVLLLGFKKGTRHAKYICWLLKKERKESDSMLFSVSGAYFRHLCGGFVDAAHGYDSPERPHHYNQ